MFFLFLVITFGLFGHTLSYDFVIDDKIFITDNVFIKHLDRWSDFWIGFNSRVFPGLTFGINYAIHGLNPAGYRIINFILHAFNTFLVFQLIQGLLQTPWGVKSKLYSSRFKLAFVASLIFCVHPIQTESVIYICQRITLMATTGYLLALVFYIRARIENKGYLWGLSYLGMLLGIFSKEMTITIPASLVVCEGLFFEGTWPRLKNKFLLWSPYLLFVLGLWGVFTSQSSDSFLGLKSQLDRGFSWSYFLTELNVLRTYLGLAVFPFRQRVDYDFPLVRHFWEWGLGLTILLGITLIWFAYRCLKTERLLSFAIIWFLITTSVEVVVVSFVHKGLIYEHWMYLPMVGVSLFWATVLILGIRAEKRFWILSLSFVVVLITASFCRSFVWKNELTLWQDVLQKDPANPRAHVMIGVYYSHQKQWDFAMREYQRALENIKRLNPEHQAQLLVNMGAVYGNQGHYQKEIEYNLQALQYQSGHSQAYSNLGLAYTLSGNLKLGFEFGQRAIAVNPRSAEGYNNLGVTLAYLQNIRQAKTCFAKALDLNPDYRQARDNLDLANEMIEKSKLSHFQ